MGNCLGTLTVGRGDPITFLTAISFVFCFAAIFLLSSGTYRWIRFSMRNDKEDIVLCFSVKDVLFKFYRIIEQNVLNDCKQLDFFNNLTLVN